MPKPSASARPFAKAADPATAATKSTKSAPTGGKSRPADKPTPFVHGISGTYSGPSPTFRGHSRKLTPVNLTHSAAGVSGRDAAFVADLRKAYGNKPFQRGDADAGNCGRASSLGLLKYVSGGTVSKNANGDTLIAGRDALFQLTAAGLGDKFGSYPAENISDYDVAFVRHFYERFGIGWFDVYRDLSNKTRVAGGGGKNAENDGARIRHQNNRLRKFGFVRNHSTERQLTELGLSVARAGTDWRDVLGNKEPPRRIFTPEEEARLQKERERTWSLIERRANQGAFRNALMQRDNGTCAVTGCTVASVIEAAHLIPFASGDSNRDDPQNGMLLRADIHILFDRYLMAINPDTHELWIADELLGSSYESFRVRRRRIKTGAAEGNLRHHFEWARQIHPNSEPK